MYPLWSLCDVCPMFLLPVFLGQFAERGMLDKAEEYHILIVRSAVAVPMFALLPSFGRISVWLSGVLAKRHQ